MPDPRAHVALLVDFANLRQQINQPEDEGDATPTGRDIARSLVQFGDAFGRVGLARAYADWSRDPDVARQLNGTRLAPVLVPATQDGEDRSHIQLTVDAMEALFNGDEPDAFIVVSSDPSLVPLVQAIRSDGSEVIVVAADTALAEEMSAEADQFFSVEDVLDGKRGASVTPRAFRTERNGGTSRPQSAGRAARGRREERDRGARDFSQSLLREPDFEDYDWTRFVRLIDELEQRLPFVGVRYLVNKVLGPHNCGIEDPRIKRDLINQAVDEGLIEMYAVGNVNDRTDPVTACRLDRENEIVVEVLGPGTRAAAAEGDEEPLPEPEFGEFTPSARA